MYFDNYTCNTDPLTSQYFDLFILIFMPVIQTKLQVNILTYFILTRRSTLYETGWGQPESFPRVCRDGPEPSQNPSIRPILAPGLCMFGQPFMNATAFLCVVTTG